MPDYEDMILERQSDIECLLDQCNEDCRHCDFGLLVHSAFGSEYICTLTGE